MTAYLLQFHDALEVDFEAEYAAAKTASRMSGYHESTPAQTI